VGHPGRNLRSRVETELIEDLFEVPLSRPAGDEEPFRYVTIG
jgi:hypothetical protein